MFHVYGLSAPDRKLVLDWLDERSVAPNGDIGPEQSKLNTLRATAGAWRGTVDADELIKDIYASRLIDHTGPSRGFEAVKYLVDTDWIILHFRGNSEVARRIEELTPEGIGISVVSMGELYEGVYKAFDPARNESALRLILL